MAAKPLTTVGILPPADFPSAAYERVQTVVCSKEPDNAARKAYAGAWHALAYRFVTCTVCDEKFSASVQDFGPGPQSAERYLQEDSLLGFFVTALSTLESFCFAANALGAMASATDFDLTNPRDITPKTVKKRFTRRFPSEQLTTLLAETLKDETFRRIDTLRNVLAHRVSSLRHHYVGGEMHGRARWVMDEVDLEIGVNLTHSCREWLANQLSMLCNAAAQFAETHL